MLKALDILSKNAITETNIFGMSEKNVRPVIIVFIIVISVISVIIATIIVKRSSKKGDMDNYIKTCSLIFFLAPVILYAMPLVILKCNQKEVPTGRYEYTVCVDDKETAAEIYDDYIVIKIEGNVWTIQDK